MATHNITSFAYRAPLRYSFSVANFPYAPKIPLAISGVYPATGPTAGGVTVNIVGSGLSGATGVTFGGVAATDVTVVNDSTVSAKTPALPVGSVDVVVTTPDGSVTLVGGYLYASGPEVASIAPAVGHAIDPHAPVNFNAVASAGIRRCIIAAFYPATGEYDLVWDGASFTPAYAQASVAVPGPVTSSFSILRTGGWPSPPEVRVFLFDLLGNEGV